MSARRWKIVALGALAFVALLGAQRYLFGLALGRSPSSWERAIGVALLLTYAVAQAQAFRVARTRDAGSK